jgi:hypothetical protein
VDENLEKSVELIIEKMIELGVVKYDLFKEEDFKKSIEEFRGKARGF